MRNSASTTNNITTTTACTATAEVTKDRRSRFGQRLLKAGLATLVAGATVIGAAGPASADLNSDLLGGAAVGGTSQGWTAPVILPKALNVTCNVGLGRLDIDIHRGNQRDFTVQVWTQTWNAQSGAWGGFAYRGALPMVDENSISMSGPDITVPAGRGYHYVYLRFMYGNQVRGEGYVQPAIYRTMYAGSEYIDYSGMCNL